MTTIDFHPRLSYRHYVLFAFITFTTVASGQSLEEAVSIALMTNPKMHQQTQRVQTKIDEESIARASYLPSINLHGGTGYEWTSNGTTRGGSASSSDRLHRYESSVALRQEIFSGFSTWHDTKRTKATTYSEQFRLLTIASEMALNVARAYLAVIMTERALELAQQNLKVHQDIFYRIYKRSESGIQSSADLSLVSGRLASAEANTIAAQNNRKDAELRFHTLTGTQPDRLVEPVPDRSLIPNTLPQVVDIAITEYPLLKSAKQDSLAANSEYQASKSRFYPDVYFSAERSWNNNLNGIIGRDDDYTLMFHVRLNVFNGGADDGRKRASMSRWYESKDIYQQTLLEVQEETNLAWEAHIQLHRQIPQLQRHVTYSMETVNAYRRQFSMGERSLLDVLNAENESLTASLNWSQAQIASLEADYRLLHISGRLLDAFKITLPANWQPSNREL
ncbi:TolC family outer membrane protein [Endozoicomonas ascidiicola]|uniref:TolC family outer membrane protein n=1 Tax=Endozoicomonas ascidiicola TaxID=1698521 RepID=UPI000AFE7A93|nr:TolC family outer membrane protein [Endozoicomonas ascidiicola]